MLSPASGYFEHRSPSLGTVNIVVSLLDSILPFLCWYCEPSLLFLKLWVLWVGVGPLSVGAVSTALFLTPTVVSVVLCHPSHQVASMC